MEQTPHEHEVAAKPAHLHNNLNFSVRYDNGVDGVSDIVELGCLLHDADVDLDDWSIKDQVFRCGVDRLAWYPESTGKCGAYSVRAVLTISPVASVRQVSFLHMRRDGKFCVRYASASYGWQVGVRPLRLMLFDANDHRLEFEIDGCEPREISLADVDVLSMEGPQGRHAWRKGTQAYDEACSKLKLDPLTAAARVIDYLQSGGAITKRLRHQMSVTRVVSRHCILVDRWYVFRDSGGRPASSLNGLYVDGMSGEVTQRVFMGHATKSRLGKCWTLHW